MWNFRDFKLCVLGTGDRSGAKSKAEFFRRKGISNNCFKHFKVCVHIGIVYDGENVLSLYIFRKGISSHNRTHRTNKGRFVLTCHD